MQTCIGTINTTLVDKGAHMQRESWKIMLACAIGAGIGSFLALELVSYLWWLGLVIGGLAGYLSYEWREIINATQRAWKVAYWKSGAPSDFKDKEAIKILLLLGTISTIIESAALTPIVGQDVHMLGAFTVLLLVHIGLPCFCGMNVNLGGGTDAKANRVTIQALFAFSLPILLFWNLPRFLWWIARHTPSTVMYLVRFSKHFLAKFFLLIHSERRLICGVDALLGTAVGYAAGSVIIGTAAGALLGLLNYELVTRRWLIPRGLLKKTPDSFFFSNTRRSRPHGPARVFLFFPSLRVREG